MRFSCILKIVYLLYRLYTKLILPTRERPKEIKTWIFSSLYFYAFTELGGVIPILVTLSAPIAIVKSMIAFVQLCYAARNLAEIDAIDASKKK